MKKVIAMLTICFMLVSLCPAAFAQGDADASREILADVKTRIVDTQDFKDFSSSVTNRNGRSEYHFNWENSSDDGSDYKSLNVTVISGGIITSYSYYDSAKRTSQAAVPAFKKMSSDEAMKKAKELADILNPMVSDEIVLSKYNKYESLTDDSFSFRIQRVCNGIPVYGDSGYVSIDAEGIELTGYNLSYTPTLSFADAASGIGADAAKSSYNENIGMKLVYQTSYKEAAPSPYLAYIPEKSGVYIDALTGEAVSPISPVYSYFNDAMADKAESITSGAAGGGSANNRFSEAELAELENLANLISVKDAEQQLRDNSLIALDASMLLKSSSVSSDSDDNYFYNLSFASEGEAAVYTSVRLNAETGEITSIRRSGKGISYDSDKTADQSLALKYASALAPSYCKADNSGEYRLETSEGNYFEFVRNMHDVPYYDNKIYLAINPQDNTIINYSISRLDARFPEPTNVISASDACTKLFEQVNYSLCYYPSCSAENMEYCDTALLVYMLDSSKSDALYADSGELISYSSEPEIGAYTDISGHYAENAINTLAAYGVGFEGSEFMPGSIITQKEFVALLTDSVLRKDPIVLTKNFDYTSQYRRAVSNGILLSGEESPDSPVTRKLAAVYMIRAAGYDEVASLKGIYNSEFADVTDCIGHISILNAMGVVSGYNGLFNPDSSLTRADAMIMIYNWLAK